jgi:hypothetical protein
LKSFNLDMPVTPEIAGSSPVAPASNIRRLAVLVNLFFFVARERNVKEMSFGPLTLYWEGSAARALFYIGEATLEPQAESNDPRGTEEKHRRVSGAGNDAPKKRDADALAQKQRKGE